MSGFQYGENNLALAFGLGLKVTESEWLGTREVLESHPLSGYGIICHSYECLLQMVVAGALWHDHHQNCPTWTDAAECRCDVEPSP